MVRSMTGASFVTASYNEATLSVDIRSVNSRYLDINVRYPRFLSIWDNDFKDIIRKNLSRGKVDLSLNFDNSSKIISSIDVDVDLAKIYYNAIKNLSSELNLSFDISVRDIYKMRGVLDLKEREPDENLKSFILSTINTAVVKLIDMREDEGLHLHDDMLNRLSILKSNLDKIESFKYEGLSKYRENLEKNIKRIFGESKELLDQKRVEFEIVTLADKVDITEELVRFRSHIDKFSNTLKDSSPIGKKLDFILQEMNREINTIGSKNNVLSISDIVIDSKTQIEKIREQIQNIE